MERTYFIQALITFGVLVLTNGQLGFDAYGRSRFISGGVYPRYPRGGRFIDPYIGGSVIADPYIDPYIGTDVVGASVYPAGGIGVIGGRRSPAVVDDSSRRNRQDINVSNNNVNRKVSTGSNNVVVNQVTNTRTCECQTGIIGGQCGINQQCVSDTSCSGGGNGVCQDIGIGGGFVGGPVIGGPVIGGPIIEDPSGFIDGHGHIGMAVV